MVDVYYPTRKYEDKPKQLKIFLAGGIDRAPDWQVGAIDLIKQKTSKSHKEIAVFNPRRKEKFSKEDYDAHFGQVKWEFDHLRLADIILFWFPDNAPCTTSLFEFGYWLGKNKVVIGINPTHYKKKSLTTQINLLNTEKTHLLHVHDTLEETVEDLF